jgi:hypothetical protein
MPRLVVIRMRGVCRVIVVAVMTMGLRHVLILRTHIESRLRLRRNILSRLFSIAGHALIGVLGMPSE